jgi:hypothetical protein
MTTKEHERIDILGLGKGEKILILNGCSKYPDRICTECTEEAENCLALHPRLHKGGKHKLNDRN